MVNAPYAMWATITPPLPAIAGVATRPTTRTHPIPATPPRASRKPAIRATPSWTGRAPNTPRTTRPTSRSTAATIAANGPPVAIATPTPRTMRYSRASRATSTATRPPSRPNTVGSRTSCTTEPVAIAATRAGVEANDSTTLAGHGPGSAMAGIFRLGAGADGADHLPRQADRQRVGLPGWRHQRRAY